MDNTYNTDFEVRLATLAKLGGDLTKKYQNIYEVDLAILAASGQSKGLDPVIVNVLPETGEEGKMYFVPNESATDKDNYKEYLWVNSKWECIGNANVNMQDYAKIVNLTLAEYDALETKDSNVFYNITDATPFVIDDYYTKSEIDEQLSNYNPLNKTTAKTSGFNFPYWNEYGQISGYNRTAAYTAGFSINGTSRSIFSTGSGSLTSIFAPTTAGTSGYVLTSSGSGAPIWTEYKSDATVYISEADVDAGTFSDEINNFRSECISNNHIMPVQLYSITDHSQLVPGDPTTTVSVDSKIVVEDETELVIIHKGDATTTVSVDSKIVVEDETELVITHEDETTTSIATDGTITGTGLSLSTDTLTGYKIYTVVTAGTITTGIAYEETTTSIATDGTITGTGLSLSEDIILNFKVYNVLSAGTITTGVAYEETTKTFQSYSYYLPSSSRLYDKYVELWFFTTEDGKTWKNKHILISDTSVTYDETTGTFGA